MKKELMSYYDAKYAYESWKSIKLLYQIFAKSLTEWKGDKENITKAMTGWHCLTNRHFNGSDTAMEGFVDWFCNLIGEGCVDENGKAIAIDNLDLVYSDMGSLVFGVFWESIDQWGWTE